MNTQFSNKPTLVKVWGSIVKILVWLGIYIPIIITIIGSIGYEYLGIQFMKDWYMWHWILLFSFTVGAPIVIVISLVIALSVYFSGKTNNRTANKLASSSDNEKVG